MKSLLGKKWTHISFLGRAPATVQALLTWLLMIDCCRGRGKLSNQGFFVRTVQPQLQVAPCIRISTKGKACMLWKLQVCELAREF